MKSAFARRRALMLEGLAEVPGVETVAPDGAFYVFPNPLATSATASPMTSPWPPGCSRRSSWPRCQGLRLAHLATCG